MTLEQIKKDFSEALKATGGISTLHTSGNGGTTWGVIETEKEYTCYVMNKGRFARKVTELLKAKYENAEYSGDSMECDWTIRK